MFAACHAQRFVCFVSVLALLAGAVRAGAEVARLDLPAVDAAKLAPEDAARLDAGEPYRFALPDDVKLDVLASAEGWTDLPTGDHRWQLVVTCPGCTSLCFGFSSYRLPWGATLTLRDARGQARGLAYDATDEGSHGQLWTPVLLTDSVEITLTVPAGQLAACALVLERVGRGYRGLGVAPPQKVGSCNVDVVCPEGDGWREEIRAVGVYQYSGSLICTGAMINNTAEDGRPYFLTAEHCAIDDVNAASVVVYWNYESPVCGELGGGSLDQFQAGATWRAGYAGSDFTLIELDDQPDPGFGVTYAGWDVTGAVPQAGITIHQPSAEIKCISFENDPLSVTSYLGTTSPGDGSHLRITDWDIGTTEHGSSGAPLFDPDHHIVGQLHGGYAACGNDLSDWYGRLSASWTGGGTADSRLSDFLDPLHAGTTVLDLYDPAAAGLAVLPREGMEAAGPLGGPFAPTSWTYTLSNLGDTDLDFSVTGDVDWVDITGGEGTLTAGGEAQVVIALNAQAELLDLGIQRAILGFVNVTDDRGSTSRPLALQVGDRAAAYSFALDTNPGWSLGADWQFGTPTGMGGEDGGSPDPTGGHTGTNVLGNNLEGNYAANIAAPSYLTTGPFNCHGLQDIQLRFWRWLDVESPPFDSATIEVSTDGQTWATLWTNAGGVFDAQWTQVTYDLGQAANDASALRVRWSLGPTDGSFQYCGWNIDDIELRAFGEVIPPVETPALRILGLAPNPGGPTAAFLRFVLPRAGRAEVAIYDLRGMRVARIGGSGFVAGENEVAWDLRDVSGRRVPSGAYLCRLETDQGTATRAITVVH